MAQKTIFGTKKKSPSGDSGRFTGRNLPPDENLSPDKLDKIRDVFVRHESISAIIELAQKDENKPYVERLVHDENEVVRRDAALVLSQHYIEKQEWKRTNDLLGHDDPCVRSNVAKALSDAAEKGVDLYSCIHDLGNLVIDPDEGVRLNATTALINAACNENTREKSMSLIADALSHRNPEVQISAAKALRIAAEKGVNISPAIPSLGNALNDRDENIRNEAADALLFASGNECTAEFALGRLKNSLSEKNFKVRLLAIETILRAAEKGVDVSLAIAAVANRLHDKETEVRKCAAKILAVISGNGVHITSAIHPLGDALSDKNPVVGELSSKALGNAATNPKTRDEAVDVLINAFARNDTRQHAVSALLYAMLDERTRDKAIEVIGKALEDPNPDVCRDAAKVLSDGADKGMNIGPAMENLKKKVIDKKNRKVGSAAACAIANAVFHPSTKTEALSVLESALELHDPAIRAYTAKALALASEKGADITPIIKTMGTTLDDKKHVKIWTARAIANAMHHGFDVSVIMDHIIKKTGDSNSTVRYSLISGLRTIGERGGIITPALAALGRRLKDDVKRNRQEARESLVMASMNEKMHDEALGVLVSHLIQRKGLARLINRLFDSKEYAKEESAMGILQLAEKGVPLEPMAEKISGALFDSDPAVRRIIALALLTSAERDQDITAAMPNIVKAIPSKDEKVSETAVLTVKTLNDKKKDISLATDALAKAVRDNNLYTRWTASEILRLNERAGNREPARHITEEKPEDLELETPKKAQMRQNTHEPESSE